MRAELHTTSPKGAYEYLSLDPNVPTILILGGSQGAQTINDNLLEALPSLLKKYQVIHQVGQKNLEGYKNTADVVITDRTLKDRYKIFGFLNVLALRMAAGASELIISRAGASAIFEIATWGRASIIIPIPGDVSHDQKQNAFTYARSGAALVVEQANLTPHLLESEIDRVVEDKELRKKMEEAALAFAKPQAAEKIAREIIAIALEHEK